MRTCLIFDDACSLIEKGRCERYSTQKVSFQKVSRGEQGISRVEGWGTDYNLVSECGKTLTRGKTGEARIIESVIFPPDWLRTWESCIGSFKMDFMGRANWKLKRGLRKICFRSRLQFWLRSLKGNGLIQFVTQLTSRFEPSMESINLYEYTIHQILEPCLSRWSIGDGYLFWNISWRDRYGAVCLFGDPREGSRRPLKARE